MRRNISAVIVLAALLAAGCAFVPRHNARLEEARAAYAAAQSDPQVARHAAAELRVAEDFLQRAAHARDTLDDPAQADHLAYMAKQRAAIARQVARLRESLAAVRVER